MCIAFWTLTHPRYALIIAANRDEFLSRPTIPATWHGFNLTDGKDVLSGRDAMAGGTWLGINRRGDVGLLTNITEQVAKYTSSRGDLVSHYLTAAPTPDRLDAYVERLRTDQRPYAGFNLFLVSPSSTNPLEYRGVIVTNSRGGGQITSRALSEPECLACGLSNSNDAASPVPTEEWPKVAQGKALFEEVARRDLGEEELVEALCGVMSVENPDPPKTRYGLRTTISVPPLPVEPNAWSNPANPPETKPLQLPASTDAAPALTEPSSRRDFYGTRLTSIILITRSGRVTFIERDVWAQEAPGAKPIKQPNERRFTFDLAM